MCLCSTEVGIGPEPLAPESTALPLGQRAPLSILKTFLIQGEMSIVGCAAGCLGQRIRQQATVADRGRALHQRLAMDTDNYDAGYQETFERRRD